MGLYFFFYLLSFVFNELSVSLPIILLVFYVFLIYTNFLFVNMSFNIFRNIFQFVVFSI